MWGWGAHKHTYTQERSREEEAAKRPVHFNPFHKSGGDKEMEGLEGEKARNKL